MEPGILDQQETCTERMGDNDKQYSVHAIMTVLYTKCHNGDRRTDRGENGSGHRTIDGEALASVLSDETALVIYHPTLVSQCKAILHLLKTALLRKKRDGFIIIGRTTGSKQMRL